MRVLYLSRADAFDDKSSLVIIAKSVFKHMLAADPELYVTWVIPRAAKADDLETYVLGELPDPKRLGFLRAMPGLSGRTLGYLLTEDVWYTMTQTKVEVPYDVVLTNQLALTPIWATVLANRYQSSRFNVKTPIVNWQMWTATLRQLREVPEYYAGEADVIAESLSSLYAWNIWESEILYASHLETMERWCKPEAVELVRRQSEVVSNGVDVPRLDAIRELRNARLDGTGRAKRALTGRKRSGPPHHTPAVESGPQTGAPASLMDGPTLFWGGRLANQKKPRVTFPLMESIRQATGVHVLVSTNRTRMTAHGEDPVVAWAEDTFPGFETHTGMDRTQFGELMARGDVFLCNSASESYGLAWLEMLAVGMLGVFEDHWWVRQLLPDWYPFVTPDHGEQIATATALLRSWPDGAAWREIVPKMQAWIAEQHNEVRAAERILDRLHALRDEAVWAERAGGSIARLVRDAAMAAEYEDGLPVPLNRVYAHMTKLSKSHREFGKNGDVLSGMYVRRLLEAQGWRDICRSALVEFVPPR